MILDLIITFWGGLIAVLDWLLPNWSLPDYMFTFMDETNGIVMMLNGFLPVKAFIICLGLVLSFEGGILLFKLITGFMSLIRGGGKVDI